LSDEDDIDDGLTLLSNIIETIEENEISKIDILINYIKLIIERKSPNNNISTSSILKWLKEATEYSYDLINSNLISSIPNLLNNLNNECDIDDGLTLLFNIINTIEENEI
jgi:hypothetical protein